LFDEFWSTLSSKVIKLVPCVVECARRFILIMLQRMYQRREISEMQHELNFEQKEELEAYIERNGLTIEENYVIFPLNAENQLQTKVLSESLAYERIHKVV